jgi:hypothetical protein
MELSLARETKNQIVKRKNNKKIKSREHSAGFSADF